MRCLRLLLLGLASVYPLYWIAQFLLFFAPETALGFWLGEPVRVLDVSYLQATAVVQPHAVFPQHWEALTSAAFFSALILGLRSDRFLSGAFAIVVLGQAAMLPFINIGWSVRYGAPEAVSGMLCAFALSVVGLYRILRNVGGADFYERLALVSLMAVLPQAVLWLILRIAYPYFDTRLLLVLLVPLYLAAIVAALLPAKIAGDSLANVPWTEILASSAIAGLLIIAISLSGNHREILNSRADRSDLPLAVSR